jgi:hypothetical protein
MECAGGVIFHMRSGRLGGVFVRGALCSWLIIGEREWRFLDVTGEIARIDLIDRRFAVIWVHRLRLQRVALWC